MLDCHCALMLPDSGSIVYLSQACSACSSKRGMPLLQDVVQSCWAKRPKDRLTFAQLSVTLGQLSAQSPSQGAGMRAAPAVSPGLVVTAASLSSQDLFVLRSTGALVTVTWLFENGCTVRAPKPTATLWPSAGGSPRVAH